MSGRSLLQFSGDALQGRALEMLALIEEGCGQVDERKWQISSRHEYCNSALSAGPRYRFEYCIGGGGVLFGYRIEGAAF